MEYYGEIIPEPIVRGQEDQEDRNRWAEFLAATFTVERNVQAHTGRTVGLTTLFDTGAADAALAAFRDLFPRKTKPQEGSGDAG